QPSALLTSATGSGIMRRRLGSGFLGASVAGGRIEAVRTPSGIRGGERRGRWRRGARRHWSERRGKVDPAPGDRGTAPADPGPGGGIGGREGLSVRKPAAMARHGGAGPDALPGADRPGEPALLRAGPG